MNIPIGSVSELGHDPGAAGRGNAQPARYTRRLSDKLLIAFEQACDQSEFEAAEQLLQILEGLLSARTVDIDRRRDIETLVGAHETLWLLKHGARNDTAAAVETGTEAEDIVPDLSA